MQEIINKAIAYITEQMMKEEGNSAVVAIEEYLTDICKNEAIANKLLNKEKTLKGALKEIENAARKIQKNNIACIGPWEGFAIVEKYYSITEEDKQASNSSKSKKDMDLIDVMDFM